MDHGDRPGMQRQQSVKDSLRLAAKSVNHNVADFLGISASFRGPDSEQKQQWKNRARSMHTRSRLSSRVKQDRTRAEHDYGASGAGSVPDSADTLDGRQEAFQFQTRQPLSAATLPGRQWSYGGRQISTTSSRLTRLTGLTGNAPTPVRKKESVLKMTYDAIKGSTLKKPVEVSHKQPEQSRSYTKDTIASYIRQTLESLTPIDTDDTFFDETPAESELHQQQARTFAEGGIGYRSLQSGGGLSVGGLDTIAEGADVTVRVDEDGSSGGGGEAHDIVDAEGLRIGDETPGIDDRYLGVPMRSTSRAMSGGRDVPEEEQHMFEKPPVLPGWHTARESKDVVDRGDVTDGAFLDAMTYVLREVNNSNRRQFGKGIVGSCLNWQVSEDVDVIVQKQINELPNYRPFFTYWVTFVQIVVFIFAVIAYGIAPIGIEETRISGNILQPNLAIEQVSYVEEDNLWIGPRQADLIHLGAKYSPCMRLDANVNRALDAARRAESQSACCVRNDGSGCVQFSRDKCSPTLSTWYKWNSTTLSTPFPGPNGRVSGTVCGQDPRYCLNPASIGAVQWADDITTWPICYNSDKSPSSVDKHMTCGLVGRPCCIGIQGACIITTREHCDFRRGYFHEEAFLCSQVSCMNEICGMLPFADPSVPDQFYRLWTSLFLHAGLLQLIVSVLFQACIMRDYEKLVGWARMSLIYIFSGIAGSLASAIFLPYHVEAGPSGSQFGVLALILADYVHNWQLFEGAWKGLLKMLLIVLVLFLVGLLPYVDNWAHLIGLVYGFLLSFAIVPHIKFNTCDGVAKTVGVIVCLIASCVVVAGLFVLFYVSPVYECPYCEYFNCIPFTSTFCKSMAVNITDFVDE